MTEKNVVTAIHDTLHEEMAADDRVVVLGEDIATRGGVFRVTQGFLDEFGEQRVIDTPLAEGAGAAAPRNEPGEAPRWGRGGGERPAS